MYGSQDGVLTKVAAHLADTDVVSVSYVPGANNDTPVRAGTATHKVRRWAARCAACCCARGNMGLCQAQRPPRARSRACSLRRRVAPLWLWVGLQDLAQDQDR